MTITLTYTTTSGAQEQTKFQKDVEKIDLSKREITSIDLTPLKSCTHLRYLDLGRNQLQSIELSPLSSCIGLQSLNLGYNQLQSIDITTLSICTNLHWFSLVDNQIHSIDVTPFFRHNEIQVGSNHGLTSWLHPISGYLDKRVVYSWPTCFYPWSLLYQIAGYFRNDYRIQHDICRALGLADFGFVDYDLTKIFLSIIPETSLDDVREIFINLLVKEIAATVDRGGSTTGFNLEELVTKYSEIATRGHHIIALRKKEIEQVRIPIEGNEVDLRELWLTAHGYRILSALEYRLTTDLDGFESVKGAFKEVGLTLNSGTSPVSGVVMSDDLKKSIWWIAENRGMSCRQIQLMNSKYAKKHPLILVTQNSDLKSTNLSMTQTLTESLWDTAKDNSIPIVFREPALIELAQRKDPGVIAFCDYLLRSDDSEYKFTALKTLETLNTHDAAQRLLVICSTSSSGNKKIALNVLARILSSSQREGFRRLIRSVLLLGVLDVTNWTPIALRVLEGVCAEKGIQIVDREGAPLSNLEHSFQTSAKSE